MLENEAAKEAIAKNILSLIDLADIAYVKEVEQKGRTAYGLFSPKGEQLAVLPTREAAFVAARQNELNPVSVH